MNTLTLVLIDVVVVLAVMFYIYRSIRIVPQGTAAVVERFGRYARTLQPGLRFLVPGIDRVRATLDLREQVLPFPPQEILTEDNQVVYIDWVVYFQVIKPLQATYEIRNFVEAMDYLVSTTVRKVVGNMDLKTTLTSRDRIDRRLHEVLAGEATRWGIGVSRVELRTILPSQVDLELAKAANSPTNTAALPGGQASRSREIGPEATILGSIVVAGLAGLSSTAYGRVLNGVALTTCIILFLVLFRQAKNQRTLTPELAATVGPGDAAIATEKVDRASGRVWIAGHTLPARSLAPDAVFKPGTEVRIIVIDNGVLVVSQPTST